MVGVGVGVQQADGHRRDTGRVQGGQQCQHTGLVEFTQYATASAHALVHFQAQAPWHQWGRPIDVDVVLLEAVLVCHLQRIAVATGGDQCGHSAAPLDQRVGRQGGAVDHQVHLLRGHPGIAEYGVHTFEYPGRRLIVIGQHLAGSVPVPMFEHHVGERATDVDCQASAAAHRPSA